MNKIKKVGCVISILLLFFTIGHTCFADAVNPISENKLISNGVVNNQTTGGNSIADNPKMIIYIIGAGFVLMFVACVGLVLYAIIKGILKAKMKKK